MHAKAWRLSKLGIVEIPTGGWNAGVEWNRGSGRGWNQRGTQRTGHRKNSDFIWSQSVLIRFNTRISKCEPWTWSISIIWELRHANSFCWVIINKTSILGSHLKKMYELMLWYNKNKAVWQKQSRVFVCVYVLFRHKWLINLNCISNKNFKNANSWASPRQSDGERWRRGPAIWVSASLTGDSNTR